MSFLAIGAIIVPLLAAIIMYPLGALHKPWRNYLLLAALVWNLLFALSLLIVVATGGPVGTTLIGISVPGTVLPGAQELALSLTLPVSLVADFFAAVMLVALAAVLLLLGFYSYSSRATLRGNSDFALLLGTTIGLNGLILSAELIGALLFWEILTFSTVFLVMERFEATSSKDALKVLGANETASLIWFWGVLLTLANFGGLEMGRVASWLAEDQSGVRGTIALLFVVALVIRAALLPAQTWMTTAARCSRPAVAALLVGAFNLLGFYIMLRLLAPMFLVNSQWATVIGIVGIVSVLIGSYWALRQKDIRLALAYHAVAQFGLLALGLASGVGLGIAAATAQLLALVFILPGLYLVFPMVYQEEQGKASTDRPPDWPLPAIAALLLALAAAGAPPLIGFGSRLLLFQAGLTQPSLWLSLLMLVALAGIALSVIFFARLMAPLVTGIPGLQSGANQIRLSIASPVTAVLLAAVALVTLIVVPWILFLEYVVTPIAGSLIPLEPVTTLPLGWQGFAAFLLIWLAGGLGVYVYARGKMAASRTVERMPVLGTLHLVSQAGLPIVDDVVRWADEGRLDPYSLFHGLVIAVGGLFSAVFLAITRRLGGW